MNGFSKALLWAGLAALIFTAGPVDAAISQPGSSNEDMAAKAAPVPGNPTPTMSVEDVRVGMKGYGLTVFHGTKIEPFPVQVVSVVPNFTPKHATIWILSKDPRLEKSGPVEGMSGSPIYLWPLGEEKKLGEGGKLIGAFAFGYPFVKECLAGVQPIAFMRDVAHRARIQPKTASANGSGAAAAQESASVASSLRMLARLNRLAMSQNTPAMKRFRMDAVLKLLRDTSRQSGIATGVTALAAMSDNAASDMAAKAAMPDPPASLASEGGRVTRLLLPMSVGSPALASFVGPLLEPMGIAPVAGGGGGVIAGQPPAGIDAAHTYLEPGSVLSIPLAWGDMDLAAVGTVTDVLPDGTVLGFGHQMFGQGSVALPLATGYVHFFVPRINVSFKQAGSLRLRGSIVEDEATGVAGVRGEHKYTTAPMDVNIRMPGQKPAHYQFTLVNHPRLTPLLSMVVASGSLIAKQQLPLKNTVHLKSDMVFSGGRTLSLNTMLVDAKPTDLFLEIMPVISAMMSNPYKNLELKSIDLSARVEPKLLVSSLISARLDKAVVAPGENIRITATVQPYGKAARNYHAQLRVPPGLAEGDYPLFIVDAASYEMLWAGNRPYLFTTTSVDDLTEMLQKILSIRRDALYVVMELPDKGVAVGRVALPHLPSSRQAMIATPTSTEATPFTNTAKAVIPTRTIVQGQQMFTVSVRENKSIAGTKGAALPPSPQGGE